MFAYVDSFLWECEHPCSLCKWLLVSEMTQWPESKFNPGLWEKGDNLTTLLILNIV